MFLRQNNFLEEERNAPLLNLNNSFLQEGYEEPIFKRTKAWLRLVGNTERINLENIIPSPSHRIICHDAERTLLDPDRRKTLVKLLNHFETQFKDYHQGLALITGFLLMSLTEQDVAALVTAIATKEKYIPKYWRAEAVAAARDAYVWMYLVEKFFPDVAIHLKKNHVMPETFCQKWYVAMCINVLPFKALYRFFELFLERGHPFLLQFGLSVVKSCKQHILKSSDVEIYKILRFDTNLLSDDEKYEIVENATKIDLKSIDIKALREEAFEKNLKQRLEKAREALKKGSDSDEDISEDEEGGAECEICTNMAPEFYCEECTKFICGNCHMKSKGGHSAKHKVDEEWEKYCN